MGSLRLVFSIRVWNVPSMVKLVVSCSMVDSIMVVSRIPASAITKFRSIIIKIYFIVIVSSVSVFVRVFVVVMLVSKILNLFFYSKTTFFISKFSFYLFSLICFGLFSFYSIVFSTIQVSETHFSFLSKPSVICFSLTSQSFFLNTIISCVISSG